MKDKFITHRNGTVYIVHVYSEEDEFPLVEVKDLEGVVLTRENVSHELAVLILQLGNNEMFTYEE